MLQNACKMDGAPQVQGHGGSTAERLDFPVCSDIFPVFSYIFLLKMVPWWALGAPVVQGIEGENNDDDDDNGTVEADHAEDDEADDGNEDADDGGDVQLLYFPILSFMFPIFSHMF